MCQVPLLDMRRYHLLLAGASWMAEYGDPDNPDEWAYIGEYSPYQHIDADTDYPPILVTTSTRDDRVHPGTPASFVARLEETGHRVSYYENIEGGHGGAADNKQSAFKSALAYEFLAHNPVACDLAEFEARRQRSSHLNRRGTQRRVITVMATPRSNTPRPAPPTMYDSSRRLPSTVSTIASLTARSEPAPPVSSSLARPVPTTAAA